VAQVAIIKVFVSIISDQTCTLKISHDKSTLSTVFVSILVHEFRDCCLISFISCEPLIPLGNHGKFSISVVVVSCHHAATPPAINHSYIIGFNIALAVYIAAVCHAGPDQIIITFSI